MNYKRRVGERRENEELWLQGERVLSTLNEDWSFIPRLVGSLK